MKNNRIITFFLLASELIFRKINIKRNVQIPSNVVVLVVRHSLAFLLDLGAWPCDLFANNLNFVSVQVSDLGLEANKSVLQCDRYVCE